MFPQPFHTGAPGEESSVPQPFHTDEQGGALKFLVAVFILANRVAHSNSSQPFHTGEQGGVFKFLVAVSLR